MKNNLSMKKYFLKQQRNGLKTESSPTRLLYTISIFAFLTLGVGQMWGDCSHNGGNNISFNNCHFYFNPYYDATNSINEGTIQLAVRKYQYDNCDPWGWYTGVTNLTAVTNTRLYYASTLEGVAWTDDHKRFHGWAIISNSSAKSNGDTEYWSGNNSTWYSDFKAYGLNSGNTYLFRATSATKGNTIETTGTGYLSNGVNDLNKIITVKAKVSTNDGNSYSEATSPGTLSASSKKFTAHNTCNTSTSLSSNTITCGYTATTTLTAPSTDPTGYTWVGWYNASGTQQTTSKTLTIYPTADATYYAYYKAKQTTITLNGNAGTGGSASVTGTYGLDMPSATMPTRNGYIFEGYYDNASGGTQYYTSSGTSARTWDKTSNTTLYAHWTPIWQLYNNTTHIGDFEYISDYEYTLTVTLSSSNADQMHFKKDGTTFYYTGADNPTTTNNTLVSGNGMISYTTMGLSDIEYTLTIKSDNSGTSWYLRASSGATYSVTYNGNSPTSGSAPVDESSPYAPGSNVTVLGNTGSLAKTGYTFNGWNTQADGNGTDYTVGSTISSIDANKTLYAKWTENLTTVTINVNPASAGTLTMDASAFTPGNTTTAGVATSHTVVATANSGKVFLDWSTSGNATGTNTTNTFTLNGNGNGGTGTLTANFGVASGWYMEGNDFGGWGGNDCSSLPTTYPFSRPYRDQANTYYIPVTLESGSYFKVHNGDGCSNVYNFGSSSSNVTVSKNNVYNLTADASHSGIVSSTMSDVWVVLNTSTKKFWVQDPATYYTITIENGSSGNILSGTEGTITIKSNNLGNFDTKQFASGETIKLSVSAKSGYYIDDITIGGNSVATDVNAASYNGTATMPAGDATLTVSYKRIYTVTYGAGTSYTSMGSVSTEPSITSGSYVLAGTSITFTATPNLGYKFIGWYSDAGCNTQVSTDNPYTVSVTAAKTVYAKFELMDIKINSDINGSWPTPWTQTIMTHSSGSPAIYTYSTTFLARATEDDSTPYNSGYHFTFVDSNNELLYDYNGVQAPTSSGSSIDGVRKTQDDYPTIQFGLTRKSDVTITLTLQSIDDATKPTVNINADPYYTVSTAKGSGAAGITINPTSVEARSGANSDAITATIAPGYTFTNWTPDNPNITINSPNDPTTTVRATGDGTLIANATANSYAVRFNGNGHTGGSMDELPARTFGVAFNLTANAFTKKGYTFAGWATEADGKVVYTDGVEVSNLTPVNNGTATLYAKWTPNQYTVTLKIDEEHHGSLEGKTTSQRVTYDAATETVPYLPKGEDGYALMGYYTDHNGAGTKLIDATGEWIASVDGYTDGSKNWVHDGDVTLYAYYKKAEITELEINPSIAAVSATVTVVPTLAPKPDGDTKLCWRLLRSNDNEITGVTFSPTTPANAVSFTAPNASGTYKVACILRTGTVCGEGEVLDSVVQSFVVAGEHTVNVHYQDASGRTLSASTEVTGSPLEWSGDIAAPTITGYRFIRWEAGDGITIQDGETNTNPTHIKAAYDGDLTAIYSKKNMIYFNNTLGWSAVYVYFYENNKYWGYEANAGKGTGSNPNWRSQDQSSCPFKHKGAMTQIEGTNIWYYDCEANSVNASYTNVAFNENDQTNYDYFSDTKVVRRGDYHSSLPMFVPLTGVDPVEMNNKQAKYYNEGYWMNYPENTGYTLHIYSGTTKEVQDEIRSIAFPFTADKTMPMEVTLELNANTTYGYEIHRADNTYHANGGTIKINASSDIKLSDKQRGGIKTSAAGDYVFKLNFGNSNGYGYLFSVQYPASVGSYRLVYKDLAEWSQGSAHTDAWSHPSRVIYKNEGAADTVSFFVAKGHTPTIQIQKIKSIDNEGNINWENVGSATSYDTVSAAGVYNFITSQTASALSIDKVEPYTGNYYIRTDNAGSTKWDNYRAADHQMTYSEFSKDRATNTFGELYTHYYMHWCPRGTNVKFCIANDYSSCITDTLVNDVVSLGNMADAGWLNRDNASEVYRDKFSANIRFMYDERTNKISRAYMSSSTNTDRKFLVLKSNTEFWNSDGSALSGSGESAVAGNYEAIFKDNEDWIYEREIKLNPGQKFKLYASYAQETAQENGSQHFCGNYAGDDWVEPENYVALVGGSGAPCNVRIIYDFKTNRLMSAYVPDNDNPIDGEHAINADIMIVRYHQEAGQQITFNTGGSLTEVKTVYGVMRFNRWILNNRQNPEDHLKDHCATDEAISIHHPMVDAGSMKSSDERGLYWISFPFDVNLSEVFGFGTYGTHWIIMTYNGEERAKQGYWADSEGFWEYIWDRRGVVLEKGKGYVLALELGLMQANNRTFWNNEIQQVELFFPSTTSSIGTIKETDVDIDVPAWQCTIDRTNSGGTSPDINKNRTKVDSHWNIIGVPSYANYGTTLTDEGGTITWKDNSALDWTEDLPFLYEWNANDNTYTVQSGTKYPFKAMHSYYVQYHGRLHWSLASATPASVASRTYAEAPRSEEFRLEFLRNDKMEDQTFVKLSDKANVSANFVFGEDMIKENNATRANIYTIVENYLPVAGNTLPISEQTTVVPVGVKIKSAGDYTFSIPEGTEGIGITLVDNETGVRTLLSALDYTIHLEAGTYDQRFILEISPIQNTPTGLEEPTSDSSLKGRAQKRIIDGVLYIVKDGKIFDARGVRVE